VWGRAPRPSKAREIEGSQLSESRFLFTKKQCSGSQVSAQKTGANMGHLLIDSIQAMSCAILQLLRVIDFVFRTKCVSLTCRS
jgi:hypothetical protein